MHSPVYSLPALQGKTDRWQLPMNDGEQTEPQWADYYKGTADRPPRELLRQAVSQFETNSAEARIAIDLGCGAGLETGELLKRGWRVVAIDNQPEAIIHLQSRTSLEEKVRLETHLTSFEQAHLPPADLVWAGLSLPFHPPEHFDALWAKVVSSLRSGGRFAGDFFGPRHFWADNKKMTFHTVEQVKALFGSLQIEYFLEEEGRRRTALQGMQYWHGFSVIASKP